MLASMALPLLATAAESVPYASDMTTWQIENVNGDLKTWEVDNSSFSALSDWKHGLKYSWNSASSADDWAISPAIHLESGVEYKVKMWSKNASGTYAENFAIYMAKSNQPDDLKEGNKLLEKINYIQTAFERNIIIITPEETGDYYFGVYCFSEKDKMSLYVTGFEVAENKFMPASVSGLKVEEGANRALEATISWTLPTKDNDGADLPEDAVFNNVKIYRDGELIDTLDGDATSWTDNEEKGLKSGFHTYEVEVTVNNTSSAKAKVESKYVGPLVAANLPWEYSTSTMSPDDFSLFFTTEKGEGSQTTDAQMFKSYFDKANTNNYIAYTPNKDSKINDWLFLPPVNIETAGIYRFLTPIAFSSVVQDLEIWICSADNSSAKIKKVGTIGEFTGSSKTDYFVAFNIDEPGNYVFALHTADTYKSYSPMKLYGFTIEEWYEAPTSATEISTEVKESGIVVKWTNPAVNNFGADIESLTKVEVYRDGEIVATLTSDITPGQESTYTDVPENGGSFKYHVIPFIGDKAAEGTALTAQSEWYGDKIQDLPYSYNLMDLIKNKLYSAIDIDGNGFTWDIPASSWPTLDFSKATTDGSNNHDRLLTPPFKFDKAGYYHVVVKVRGGATNSHLKVGLVSEDATEAALINPQSIDAVGYNSEKERSLYFKLEEAGRYCLGIDFDEFFSKSDMALKISGVSVEYTPVLPSVATDLAVTPGENYAHTATLEWTNPTTSNIEGVAPTLVKAVISRNGEQVAEVTEGLVAGEKSTWVDNEVPGAGHHTYSVQIHGEDGPHAEEAPSVKSPWIGAGVELPFSQENFEAWTLINVDGDTNTWGDQLSWSLDGNDLKLFTGSKDANEWAISPRMNFDEGEYEISLTPYFKLGDSAITFDLYFGTGTEIDDMGVKIGTVNCPDAQMSELPQTFKVAAVNDSEPALLADDEEAPEAEVVKIPAGVGTIGFHANVGGSTHVKAFSVTKSQTTGVETIEVSNGFAISGSVVLLPENASDVVVADIAGRIIFVADYADSIDLSAFEKGTYVISAVVDGKKAQVKVIR